MSERVTTLTDGVKTLAGRVENHNARLVRLETIVEIKRPDSGVLRIGRDPADDRKWRRDRIATP